MRFRRGMSTSAEVCWNVRFDYEDVIGCKIVMYFFFFFFFFKKYSKKRQDFICGRTVISIDT